MATASFGSRSLSYEGICPRCFQFERGEKGIYEGVACTFCAVSVVASYRMSEDDVGPPDMSLWHPIPSDLTICCTLCILRSLCKRSTATPCVSQSLCAPLLTKPLPFSPNHASDSNGDSLAAITASSSLFPAM